GVSVFSVANDGTLTNVDNVTDAGALELKGATSVTTQVVDGITYLFVAGVDDNGVSVFRFGHNIIDETAAAVQVAENGTGPTDPIAKVDAADPVVFSIDGGADAALFTVDAATGEVSFIAAPDFEAPQDADGDNVYEVIIKGDDDIITETKAISIEVTNVGGLIVKGSSADETLTGAGEEDTLKGKKGEDKLKGLGGNDLLNGGKHKDKLIGGDGEDAFLFADKLKDEFADKIKDFEVGVDMIYFDNAIFTALDDGALKSKFFDTGKTADSGKDRILYQEDKGWLRYDADGKGGADAVKFARIGKNLDLSADDFLVV
ncbi:MAG: hypothetical protein GY798_07330, partial [Hyphomicrobiales bacterium]|nr:hypothetical protein [Hyphomicrobiales bacterium]